MNETVAETSLGNQTPGHFLVRISSSRDHEGVFVLAVKTRDSGVIQIRIEVSLVFRFILHELICLPVQKRPSTQKPCH